MSTKTREAKRTTTLSPTAPPPPKTSTLTVPMPAADASVTELAKRAPRIESRVQALVVRDQDTVTEATMLLSQIAAAKKEIEAKRLFFVKPIKEHAKAIDEFFRGLSAPLDVMDQLLRQKVIGFREEELARVRQEAAAREAEQAEAARKAEELRAKAEKAKGKKAEKLEEAAQEAQEVAVALQVPRPEEARAQLVGVATRKPWTFDVVDFTQVPREYLELNDAEVREAIRNGVRDVPGLRIYQKEILAVGGR